MKKAGSTLSGMALSLTIICLVFTGMMAAVYEVTLEPIALAKKQKQEDAIKAVQNSFDSLATDTVTIASGIKYQVFKTYTDGKWTGTAVESRETGFGGEISVMVGFDNKGDIVDYSVLSHSETPGLGSKMDTWFKKSIPGRSMNGGPLKVSKDGGDVDAITAATISSRAFLKTINRAFEAYELTVEQQ